MHTLGWLAEPESRPSFTDLVSRLNELLEDPLRYILTTSDGRVQDYSKLPSNTLAASDFTYENPFLPSESSTELPVHDSAYQNAEITAENSANYQNGNNTNLLPTFDEVQA